MRTVHARLIGGAGHHAAPAGTSHQDGTPLQGRPGQLLDGGEKRVHVDV